MKKRRFYIIALLLALCTLFSAFLTSCESSHIIYTDNAEDLCEDFIDFVIANDYDSAYAMFDHFVSRSDFDEIWEYVRNSLKDSRDYDLDEEDWQTTFVSGLGNVTYVTFKLESSDGKTCYIRLTSSDANFRNHESIVGVYFLDSTDFVASTKTFVAVNIVLCLVSCAFFGFCVWMLVDCIKRRMKKKVLWSILIFVGGGFSFAVQNGTFGKVRVNVSLLSMLSRVEINPMSLSVAVAVTLPIGAVIYFFMRKKLTLKDEVPDVIFENIETDVEKLDENTGDADTKTEETGKDNNNTND